MDQAHREQLEQIANAGDKGVWAGDLINKPKARDLVRDGLAHNSGGSPAALSVLTITDEGRAALKAEDIFFHAMPKADACDHDFQGWREFEDGRGGERVCTKCGMGAMAYTLSLDF